MANLRDIKNRIKSVKSTGKITQAMKMVAAAKVKKAENAAKEARPYSDFLVNLFSQIMANEPDLDFKEGKFNSSLENFPELLKKREVDTVGILVITSDKGLAGSYNTNIIKKTLETIVEYQKQGIKVKLFISGIKGISSLKKMVNQNEVEIVKSYSKIPAVVEVEVANMIAEDLADAYIHDEIDKIEVITTRFISMLSYKVGKQTLLPIEAPIKSAENKTVEAQMLFKPNEEAVLQKLVPLYVANCVFRAMREASASELAARMNAMSNATKNAEEIVRSLSITYNKARQYSITQEINEVVSGANAIE